MPRPRYVPVPLARTAGKSDAGVVTGERLVNWFAEPNPEGSRGPFTLRPTPGLLAWTTVGDGPIRGMLSAGGVLYVVSGEKLYSVTVDKTATLLGAIDGTGNVRMIKNETDEVVITTDTIAYVYTTAAGLAPLTESNLNGAAYQDGYGIYTQEGTQKFWISGLDDLTTIGATDFSSADALTGNVVGCISDHRELWIFKETSTEIWYDSGNADFPFERSQGGVLERGCFASGSIAKAQNAVFWLGDDLRVYRAAGAQPQPISTPQIDSRLRALSLSANEAEAFVYCRGGHEFYVLNMPGGTFVFNLSTGLWHEMDTKDENRWRVSTLAEVFSTTLVGDYENNNIYELDDDTYTDNGTAIVREAVLPTLQAQGERATMWEFYADFDAGQGLTSGQGSDPQAQLEWSDDGGRTWSNEVWTTVGKKGEYDARAVFSRLGMFRQRQLRLSISEPIKCVVFAAYAKLQERQL